MRMVQVGSCLATEKIIYIYIYIYIISTMYLFIYNYSHHIYIYIICAFIDKRRYNMYIYLYF